MGAAVYTASASAEVGTFLRAWDALLAERPALARALTPFQSRAWLASWYATLGRRPGHAPLCVTVLRDGRPALLLPLVSERRGRRRIARFADAGVSDYNVPLVVEDLPASETPALWAAIWGALAGHDLLRLEKMLPAAGDRANPLAAALPVRPCDLFGNHVALPEDWEAWRRTLDKTVRKEFERTWRVFRREPEARFERVVDPAAARALYAGLEAQQRERMAHAGDAYRLDRPAWAAFYADRLDRGLADGSVVLTALRARGTLVAALYGIDDGTRYVALRIGHAGQAWKHCAPGKLLLERTMHHLHGQGRRHVDLAVGDYFHKRVFKVERTPLVDACVALGWRGVPQAGADWLRYRAQRVGWLGALVRGARSARSPEARPRPGPAPVPRGAPAPAPAD